MGRPRPVRVLLLVLSTACLVLAGGVSHADVLFEAAFDGHAAPSVAADGTAPALQGEPEYIDGVKGKAIVLEMNRDRLEYPCAGNMLADQGTLSLWVKPLNYDCLEQRGFKVFWQVGYLDWCLYHYQQNYMLALIGGGSQPPGIAFYARPTKGNWSHYILTWDRQSRTVTVYHNGERVASEEALPPPEDLPASFCIGNATKWATPDGPYKTAFDECRIYDRALNDVEAAALYASYLPPITVEPPTWTVPRMSTPPTIDGTIGEDEWRTAACVTGFISVQGGHSYARRQTRCRLGWDDDHLYLGFTSPHKAKDDVLITVRGRDANAYEDESYEMFLWPEPDQPNLYYQIIGSLGALYDSKGPQTDFNLPGLRYEVSQEAGAFGAEFAIPFADMGVEPREGMRWQAILARNFVEGGLEFTAWSRIDAGYSEHRNAGTLVFSKDAPSVRMMDWGDLTLGQAMPRVELVNGTVLRRELAWEAFLGEAIAEPDAAFHARSSASLDPGEERVIAPEWPAVRGNHRVAALRVSEGELVLASHAVPFSYVPRLDGQLISEPSRSRLAVRLDARAITAMGVAARGTAAVVDETGASVAEAQWEPDESGWGSVTFDTSEMPVGRYGIDVGLQRQDGQRIAAWKAEWDKLDPEPDWLANPVGLDRRVPRPFTPVEVSRGPSASRVGLSVWGRHIEWDRSLLPVAMDTQGESLLRDGMTVEGETGGRPWQNPEANVEVVEEAPDRVMVRSEARVDGLKVDTVSRVEFDGMVLTTLRLEPEGGPVAVDRLAVSVPLRRELAPLLHHNGCSASGGGWAGERPDTWNSDLRPIVWLGNEKLGLCFFAEGRGGWQLEETGRAIEVLSEGETALLRLNLFDHPTMVERPVEITFGFIATPLRPMPDNWLAWSWHTVTHFQPNRGVDYVPEPHETVLSIPWWDESQLLLHEKYGDWSTWEKEKRWHHDHGRQFLKYTQTLGLGDTPERRFWGYEWEMVPRDGRSYCPASDLKHLLAAGIGERIREGGVDGLYFDVAFPKPCSNADHGCSGGYTLLAQRDLRRRAANLFEQAGSESLIFEHMSMNMYGPVMSFATVYLDGEQYYGRIHDDYRPALTLGYLRAMNVGTNWGLVPQFLPMVTTKDEEAARRASDSLVALWTLHAPLRHCIEWRAGPAYAPALELDRAFGFPLGTKRIGYWENQDVVAATPDHLKVTLYHKPGGILLVAANLSETDVDATITLSTDSLGLPPGSLRIVQTLDNQPRGPTLEGDVISTPVRSNSGFMCVLESR